MVYSEEVKSEEFATLKLGIFEGMSWHKGSEKILEVIYHENTVKYDYS